MFAWNRLFYSLGGLVACGALLFSNAEAQTAYKCSNADGTLIFTDKPCPSSGSGNEIHLGGNYPNYEGRSWEQAEERDVDSRTGEIRILYDCLLDGAPLNYGQSQVMWCDYPNKTKCRTAEDKRWGKAAKGSRNDVAAGVCNVQVEQQVRQRTRQQNPHRRHSPYNSGCNYDDC